MFDDSDKWKILVKKNLLPVSSGKFRIAAKNLYFANNSRINWDILEMFMANYHVW